MIDNSHRAAAYDHRSSPFRFDAVTGPLNDAFFDDRRANDALIDPEPKRVALLDSFPVGASALISVNHFEILRITLGWVDAEVTLEPDVTLRPAVYLHGGTER